MLLKVPHFCGVCEQREELGHVAGVCLRELLQKVRAPVGLLPRLARSCLLVPLFRLSDWCLAAAAAVFFLFVAETVRHAGCATLTRN